MKRFVFILAVLMASCSSDDSPVEEDKIVISEDNWWKADHKVLDGEDYWSMHITAMVKNEGKEHKTGKIRFVIERNGWSYLNSDTFTIDPGETLKIGKTDTRLLTQEEIDEGYDYVEFLETE